MENKLDPKSLIGQTIEVIDENENAKKILVKEVYTNSTGENFLQDENGKLYSENDINYAYKLTLGGCLIAWLIENGYITMDDALNNGVQKYENELFDLFELLKHQNYIKDDIEN